MNKSILLVVALCVISIYATSLNPDTYKRYDGVKYVNSDNYKLAYGAKDGVYPIRQEIYKPHESFYQDAYKPENGYYSNEKCQPGTGCRKCPPFKVWSPIYEGGTCICPPPINSDAVLGNDSLPVDFYWDVVACEFVPNCTNGKYWNPLQRRCLCSGTLNCPCGEIYDPLECKCSKKCNNDVQCIVGTHFDSKKCKCVRNQCAQNFACVNGTYFSDEECDCVVGLCQYSRECPPPYHFDSDVCACVPDNCLVDGCQFGEVCNPFNNRCSKACPGVKCPKVIGIPIPHVNYTVCECEFNCSFAPACPIGAAHDPWNGCACVTNGCVLPPPPPTCNNATGSFFNPAICACHQVVCDNTCLIGTIPDPANSCICVPLVP